MGRVPEAVLDPAEYRDRIRDMKLRHNLFWEEVRESFLVPRLDRRYADMPRWLRAWTKTGGKHIAIRITDMVSNPLVIGILPDRYSLGVQDAPPDNLCFTVRVEKVMLMNIGYGNRGPLLALLAGGLTVTPLFPLWDKTTMLTGREPYDTSYLCGCNSSLSWFSLLMPMSIGFQYPDKEINC